MTTAIIRVGDVTLYIPFRGTLEVYTMGERVAIHAGTMETGLTSAYLPKGKMEVWTA